MKITKMNNPKKITDLSGIVFVRGIRGGFRTAATQRVMKLVTVGQRYLPERLPVIPIRNEV